MRAKTMLDVIKDGIAAGDLLRSAGYYTAAVRLYVVAYKDCLRVMVAEAVGVDDQAEVNKHGLGSLHRFLIRNNVDLKLDERERNLIVDLRHELRQGVPDFGADTCAYCADIVKKAKAMLPGAHPATSTVLEGDYNTALAWLANSERALCCEDFATAIRDSCTAFNLLIKYVLHPVVSGLGADTCKALKEELNLVDRELGVTTLSPADRGHMISFIEGSGVIGQDAAEHCLSATKELKLAIDAHLADVCVGKKMNLFGGKK